MIPLHLLVWFNGFFCRTDGTKMLLNVGSLGSEVCIGLQAKTDMISTFDAQFPLMLLAAIQGRMLTPTAK
jgi:hypothetical protein